MTASPENLLAILVMALAAMAAKGGGFWLMAHVPPSRHVSAFLDHAPGAVFVSAAIVPIVNGGPAFWIGGVVSVIAARALGNFAWAFAVGCAAVAAVRAIS
jgi:uncharacterized membrane protein